MLALYAERARCGLHFRSMFIYRVCNHEMSSVKQVTAQPPQPPGRLNPGMNGVNYNVDYELMVQVSGLP